jgi:AcrR family transcriptional regulator
MGTYPGNITHYFKTKEEMLIELVTTLLDSYAKIVPGWEKIKNPEKRMDHILRTVFSPDWSEIADNRVYYACYYLSLANREIHTLFKDFYNQFRDILTKEVRMYLDSGVAENQGKDPETIADTIIAIMAGIGVYNNIIDDKNRVGAAGEFARQAAMNLLKNH